MAAETQYTANTGMVVMTTGNSNLDGSTGTYYDVITAASSGTLIKSVTVKAQGNTTAGMIRLFAYNGTTTKLIAEIPVPAITKSSKAPAFEQTIELDYHLAASGKLKASTQNSETFNVIAEGLDWTYYTTSVRPESTKYTANTGLATVTTANTNLDGTGTVGTNIWNVLTGASNGTLIQSVVIKAQVNTSAGMVRLFINGGGSTVLLTEIPVNAVTKSASVHSFFAKVNFGSRGFALKNGYILRATTENSESFNVIAEGLDWTYPA